MTLPIPPMFCSARQCFSPAKAARRRSARAARPARPPRRRRRESRQMTSMPVRSAITAPRRAARWSVRARARSSARATRPRALVARDAGLRDRGDRGVGEPAAEIERRGGCTRPASRRLRVEQPLALRGVRVLGERRAARCGCPRSRGRKRTTAAVTPSSEVPDISPTTTSEPAPARRPAAHRLGGAGRGGRSGPAAADRARHAAIPPPAASRRLRAPRRRASGA